MAKPLAWKRLSRAPLIKASDSDSNQRHSQLSLPLSPQQNGGVSNKRHLADPAVCNSIIMSPTGDLRFEDEQLHTPAQRSVSSTSSVVDVAREKVQERQKKRRIKRFHKMLHNYRSSRWSIRTLRREFEAVRIEEIYQKYWLGLQRHQMFQVLIVLIFFSALRLVLYNTVTTLQDSEVRLWIEIFLAVCLGASIVLAALSMLSKFFHRFHVLLGVLVWLHLVVLLYASVPYPYVKVTPMDHAPQAFYVLFLTQTILPTRRRVTFIIGVITSALDLVLIALFTDVDQYESLRIRAIIANGVLYLSAVLLGLYFKHLTDLAHRHTFLDARRFIEADLKNSREKEKQIQVKDTLLLKIIPKHLVQDMKQVLNQRLVQVSTVEPRNLFVRRHDNVSILYADIVSFTPLTVSLEPCELVKALNQLFGRFDALAHENKCLRIKILGDCYYCVCGLPTPIPSHARNCVLMGMQMIRVIRNIREESGIDTLDMRIGIHTGYVLSGVLGLKKWQYDVWSSDVTIANHMESSGKPGKVHITQTTLEELDNEFQVVRGYGEDRDDILKENNITTYLIEDTELAVLDMSTILRIGSTSSSIASLQRSRAPARRWRASVMEVLENWGAETPFASFTDFLRTRSRPALNEVNRRLERGFGLKTASTDEESEKLREYRKEMHPVTLRFKDPVLEHQCVNERDSSFKFYVMAAFSIFIIMTAIQFIIVGPKVSLYASLSIWTAVFAGLIVLTTGLKCLPCSKLKAGCWKKLRSLSETLITVYWVKRLLCALICLGIFSASLVPMFDCMHDNQAFANESFTFGANVTTEAEPCLFSTYFVCCCMLTLVACSVFIHVSYIFKSIWMLVLLIIFNILFYVAFADIFDVYDKFVVTDFLPTDVRGTLYTAVLFITLVVLDRQTDMNLRLDILCKSKVVDNDEEMQRAELVNELLLNNLLPIHVGKHFMNPQRHSKEVYHEDCRNVCVMFAAIPNFRTIGAADSGKETLRILNEIISEFDEMLINRLFDRVEKIKTIGATYMAAAGLLNKQVHVKESEEEQQKKSLESMTRFAFSMMRKLQHIGKSVNRKYTLRIGMAHGGVIAGVVGAEKPQYDIWGDAVNTASRMESNGVLGRIQVPESTAEILKSVGIDCEFRDERTIKGKGSMKVFLVINQTVPPTPRPYRIARDPATECTRL